MGIQLKFSAALLCTALAVVQVIYIPTAAATARMHPAPELEQLLQMYYNEQEREMVQNNEHEQEMAEVNGILDLIMPKNWWGTNYDPITTPRDYDVFALHVTSPDLDDAYCLYTLRDKGLIRPLPACSKPEKAECEDYTVGDDHAVTVCEGLIKRKTIKRNEYGPCYDPAKNSCPSS